MPADEESRAARRAARARLTTRRPTRQAPLGHAARRLNADRARDRLPCPLGGKRDAPPALSSAMRPDMAATASRDNGRAANSRARERHAQLPRTLACASKRKRRWCVIAGPRSSVASVARPVAGRATLASGRRESCTHRKRQAGNRPRSNRSWTASTYCGSPGSSGVTYSARMARSGPEWVTQT